MKDNYYIYQCIDDEKIAIGVKNKKVFQKYIDENFGAAPKIKKGVTKISDDIFKNIKGVKELYVPTTIKYLDGKPFRRFRGIVINYGNYYLITTKEMTPEKIRKICLRVVGIFDITKFTNYLINFNGKAPEIPNGICFIGEYVFSTRFR